MSKERQLYNYIKAIIIDEQLKVDFEEKTKNTKQIIRLCKEEYGFDDEVVVKIFKRIYYSTERQKRLNNYNKDFMIGMAEAWNRNNIRTTEDVTEYYNKLEKDITDIIHRELTEFEKCELESLIYKYRVKERDIIDKIKEKGELDIYNLGVLGK